MIEPLEPRIAPAVLVNPKTVTYTDADGDNATVKISKGVFEGTVGGAPGAGDFTFMASGAGEQLQLINLSNDAGEFSGATLTIMAARGPTGGDGFANVGYINSTGFDLGAVTVDGDLGQVDAGDATTGTTGLAGLKVHSMGRFGLATQGAGGDLSSIIVGHLGALKVTADLKDTLLAAGSIASVTIGGSILGGVNFSGEIYSPGDIGPVKVGGDIVGGTGEFSGFVQSLKKIASITVGGSVVGSSQQFTGAIRAFELGPIKIGHDLRGGAAFNAGSITTDDGGKIASVTIGGDVLGSSGEQSGAIRIGDFVVVGNGTIGNVTIKGTLAGGAGKSSGLVSGKSLGLVKIGGDIRGGGMDFAGAVVSSDLAGLNVGGSVIGGSGDNSGYVALALGGSKPGGAVKIAHSVIAGTGSQSGTLVLLNTVKSLHIGGDVVGSGFLLTDAPGGIRIGGSIFSATLSFDNTSSLTIKGNLVGTPATPARIDVGANGGPGPGLGTLTIGGRVERAIITDRGGPEPAVRIGAVKVGGDWIASSLAAGINPVNGSSGDADDTLRFLEYSGIGSINIRGTVIGSTAAGDHFGFVAERIGSFKVGGVALKLNAASPPKDVIELSRFTGDVTLREV